MGRERDDLCSGLRHRHHGGEDMPVRPGGADRAPGQRPGGLRPPPPGGRRRGAGPGGVVAGHGPHHRRALHTHGDHPGAGGRSLLLLPDAGAGPGGPGGPEPAPGHELHGPAGGGGAEKGAGPRPQNRRGQRVQAAPVPAGHRGGAQQREGPGVEIQVGPGP